MQELSELHNFGEIVSGIRFVKVRGHLIHQCQAAKQSFDLKKKKKKKKTRAFVRQDPPWNKTPRRMAVAKLIFI